MFCFDQLYYLTIQMTGQSEPFSIKNNKTFDLHDQNKVFRM